MIACSVVADIKELKPRITVFGVGGAGGNAVNNMIQTGLSGVEFVAANTDAQALTISKANTKIQMGVAVTEGLGAGSQPEIGCAAAEEVIDEISARLSGSHMIFITAGMGGGTGTGAAPVVARIARQQGILTVGVVTKPFQFEGQRRMRIAEAGLVELQKHVDTLIVIPNQNLFRVANERTTFTDAFAMADQVLFSGVACITDVMVKDGLINLDFADVRSIMQGMGKAMMGTGEASGEKRALHAAEAAIANPLLDEVSMNGARGVLISISGGYDLTLFELDEAATRIREEVDLEANIILGATFEDSLDGVVRVAVVATGIASEQESSNNTERNLGPIDKNPNQEDSPEASQFVNIHNYDDGSVYNSDSGSSNTLTLAALQKHYASDHDIEVQRIKKESVSYASVVSPIQESETQLSEDLETKNEQQQHYVIPLMGASIGRISKLDRFSLPVNKMLTAVPKATVASNSPYDSKDTDSPGFFKRIANKFRNFRRHGSTDNALTVPENKNTATTQADYQIPSSVESSNAAVANRVLATYGNKAVGKPTPFQDNLVTENTENKLEVPAFLRRKSN